MSDIRHAENLKKRVKGFQNGKLRAEECPVCKEVTEQRKGKHGWTCTKCGRAQKGE